MVLDERGGYKKPDKRPADSGLFIVFGEGRGTIIRFVLLLDLSCWPGKGVDGADEQNDYFYPRGILHREGVGRSWVINNTSNISGVE
jgi:hypothetical protein